jgi:hypothetical protein
LQNCFLILRALAYLLEEKTLADKLVADLEKVTFVFFGLSVIDIFPLSQGAYHGRV